LLSAIGIGLAFAACGESDEDKAKGQICDARDDVQAQVSELQQLTLGNATTDKVKSHLNAIKDDITKIADARGELSDLGSSLSLQDAAAQLKIDITDLAESYEKALSPIDC
jgi:hypothetical protein